MRGIPIAPGGQVMRGRDATECAIVATLTVTLVGFAPLSVTEDGVTAQLANSGAPPQLRDTV